MPDEDDEVAAAPVVAPAPPPRDDRTWRHPSELDEPRSGPRAPLPPEA